MKRKILITIIVLLNALLISCSGGHDHEKHWSYDGDTGPNYWGELKEEYKLAKLGTEQSPIDIDTFVVRNSDLPNIEFHYEPSNIKVLNNGHAIEAEVEKGNYIFVKGKRFNLLQFHFHSYSEHTVNGKHYPLEAHFVHKSKTGELAVIGVFLNEGPTNNYIDKIWEDLPDKAGMEIELEDKLDPMVLLPEDKRTFRYMGSLTTPPCTEGVNWFVMKKSINISRTQIEKFRKIYNHNYRPTQDLNGRKVFYDITR